MAFYGTSATGAGWIVPKKYIEKVGDEAFKKAPIGAGPFKFAAFNPGVELTLDAFPDYWRKAPQVKRLVMRSIPDETTRAAAVKTGEVDIAYLFGGPIAAELKRTPGSGSSRRCSTASTGWTFWTSGTRSRRGTIAASGWPRASRWTGTRSTRPRCSASASPTGLVRAAGVRLRAEGGSARLSTPGAPSSSSSRPAIPNGFDAGDLTPLPPYTRWARR